MRIPDSKEIDYEMDGALAPEWDIRDRESKEYYDRKYDRRSEKYVSIVYRALIPLKKVHILKEILKFRNKYIIN